MLADLKHALRIYRRTPFASGVAVAVLAVAMAFVTAFLSLYVDQVLRPHPGFEQSGRLVTLGQTDGTSMAGLPFPLIGRVAGEMVSLEAAAGVQTRNLPLGPEAQSAPIDLVTDGFFSGLRPRVALGRGFDATEHEPGSERVVVVSDRYWRDVLGADANILGTTLSLWFYFRPEGGPQGGQMERRPVDFRIVGVMAPEMPGMSRGGASAWLPIEAAEDLLSTSSVSLRQQAFTVVGRRASSASTTAVANELNGRYDGSESEFSPDAGWYLDAIPGIVRDVRGQRDLERQLRLLLVGSLLIALVAACNVSLFLLARAPGRRREIAIRLAVGAPFGRIARQLASEAGLIVVAAAALGALGAAWLSGMLRGLPFLDGAQWREVSLLDWRVLALMGSFLLLLTLLVSLAPVLGLRRAGIAASSREVTGRATSAQRLAGTAQIAIAAMVAAASIAFGAHLAGLLFADPGYSTRNLFAVGFSADRPSGIDVGSATVEFSRRRDALLSVPGISRASFGAPVPAGEFNLLMYTLADPRDATRQINLLSGMADPWFIELLDLRLLHGRAPATSDGLVAVVNLTVAQEYFGRDDIVGERLAIPSSGEGGVEIVGVIDNFAYLHPSAAIPPIVFLSVAGNFYFSSTAVVESTLPAAELEQRIRALTEEGGLELGVESVTPLRTLRMRMFEDERARGALTIGAALVVVILAGFGFHGIQRYLVGAGRREYAIRASLGAGPKALGRLVMRRGLMLGLPGLAVGAPLAFILVAWLRDDFVSRDISPMAVTVSVIAGLLVLVAAASLGPARQARQTQPAPLLRED